MQNGYTGTKNLESMKMAKRYNAYLEKIIADEMPDVMEKGFRVGDFGAGIGQFAEPLKKLMGSNGMMVAIEQDAGLQETLRGMGIETYGSLECVENESLDMIYSMNVLEHIENDVEMLALMTEKLKRGGKLVIYVPAFPCLFSAMDDLVGHWRRYRREDLVGKMIGSGCSIRKAAYIDSLGFPVSWIYRFLPVGGGEISGGSVALYDRWVFPMSRIMDKLLMNSIGKNLLVIGEK